MWQEQQQQEQQQEKQEDEYQNEIMNDEIMDKLKIDILNMHKKIKMYRRGACAPPMTPLDPLVIKHLTRHRFVIRRFPRRKCTRSTNHSTAFRPLRKMWTRT